MSPAAALGWIESMRTHELELKLHSERLHQQQEALNGLQVDYANQYDLAPVGYVSLSERDLIVEANRAAARLLGVPRQKLLKQPLRRFICKEDQDLHRLHLKGLSVTTPMRACEVRMLREDAAPFWARMYLSGFHAADGSTRMRVVFTDITSSKIQEEERDVVNRLLKIINSPNDLHGLMREAVLLMRNWTACDAIGVRLRDGDDFPYYEAHGFPAEFVLAENALCRRDANGQPERDAAGRPVLECMCGNILCGRFDPAKPFFTAFGSFWTNSTTALLAGTTEADRQFHTRNRCNSAGYESVAIIPLRTRGAMVGLLQLNDKRPDRFTPDLIAVLERFADSLANAISHRMTMAALAKSERFIKGTTDSLSAHVCVVREDGTILSVNKAWNDFAAANPPIAGNVGAGANYLAVCDAATGPDADIARAFAAGIRAVMAGARPLFEMEYPCHSPGEDRWFIGRVTPFADPAFHGVVIAHENITDRRRAEKALDQYAGDLRALAMHLQGVREEERAALARNLHDNLGQYLTALQIDLTWVAQRLKASALPETVALRDKVVPLRVVERELQLEIQDDGPGFAPDSIPTAKKFGMLGMRECTAAFGGTVDIQSKTGEGTTVRMRIPLARGTP